VTHAPRGGRAELRLCSFYEQRYTSRQQTALRPTTSQNRTSRRGQRMLASSCDEVVGAGARLAGPTRTRSRRLPLQNPVTSTMTTSSRPRGAALSGLSCQFRQSVAGPSAIVGSPASPVRLDYAHHPLPESRLPDKLPADGIDEAPGPHGAPVCSMRVGARRGG
jgi:hypothetical protein